MRLDELLARPLIPNDDKRFDGWRIEPLIALGIIGLPIVSVVGMLYIELTRPTFWLAVIYYFLTGGAITCCYHRYWAHRSYNSVGLVQWCSAIIGAGACEGTIKSWSQEHRAHHRYTDTDKDPYNARLGLLWSHVGWVMVRPPPGVQRSGWVDIDDLRKNKVVQWQHKYYKPLAAFMGFVFPTLVAGYYWGDWKGGFLYAGVTRMVILHHSTFSINSFAHYFGEKTFDDEHTPRDTTNPFYAFFSGGEAYHNFHHQFPMDYRNGVKWYHYDPSKWFILLLNLLGLASNLKTFPQNEIKKAEFTMKLKKLKALQDGLKWPMKSAELPLVSWEEYQKHAEDTPLLLIGGFIHHVADFLDEHPGGAQVIQGFIGKDATAAFVGGVYEHSNAAHNLLGMKRVGVLDGGYENEGHEHGHVGPTSGHRLRITSYE